MSRQGYLVNILLMICLCESQFTSLCRVDSYLFLVSSRTVCKKYNYKIKAAGKSFDIESESAENKLGSNIYYIHMYICIILKVLTVNL